MANYILTGPDGKEHTLSLPDDMPAPMVQTKALIAKSSLYPGITADVPGGASVEVRPGAARMRSTATPGVKVPSPEDTPEGLRTMAFEAGGGLLGMKAGPPGVGAGMAAGGALEDVLAGRPFSEQRAEERALLGYSGEAGARALLTKGSQVVRAGVQSLARKVPSFAEFAEGMIPGVLRRGERVAETFTKTGKEPKEIALGARGALKQTVKAFHREAETVYGDLDTIAERVVGPKPQVSTTNLREMAQNLGWTKPVAAGQTGPVGEYGKVGLQAGLNKNEAKALDVALRSDTVSFKTMRTLDSAFNKLARARQGQRLVGDTVSHQFSQLASATGEDLKGFLSEPGREELSAAKTAADKWYGARKELYGQHILEHLKSSQQPERVVGEIFQPGNVSHLDTVKEALPPEAFDRLVNSHLEQVASESTDLGGSFDHRSWALKIQDLEKKGSLERMVDPARREEMVNLAQQFLAQSKGGPKMGAALRMAGRAALPTAVLGGSGIRGYEQGRVGAAIEPLAVLTGMLHPTTRPYVGKALRSTGLAGLDVTANPLTYLRMNPQLRRYWDADILINGLGPQGTPPAP